MFRLEWTKWENGGTEEQRLKELDALLAAHGIVPDEDVKPAAAAVSSDI